MLEKFKDSIYYNYPFSFQFLKENFEFIDWKLLISNKNIDWSVELLELIENEDAIKWIFRRNEIFRNPKIASNQEIILHYFDRINLRLIPENRNIKWDENFLNKLSEKIDLGAISTNLDVSLIFIEENKKKIDWDNLSWNTKIGWTTDFIEKNKNLINWSNISLNNNLPWNDEIIEKFENSWDWNHLSQNPKILWTEALINKYQEKLVVFD